MPAVQLVVPVGHTVAGYGSHLPEAQICAAVHVVPQPPHAFGELLLMHAEPPPNVHEMRPCLHAHLPVPSQNERSSHRAPQPVVPQ